MPTGPVGRTTERRFKPRTILIIVGIVALAALGVVELVNAANPSRPAAVPSVPVNLPPVGTPTVSPKAPKGHHTPNQHRGGGAAPQTTEAVTVPGGSPARAPGTPPTVAAAPAPPVTQPAVTPPLPPFGGAGASAGVGVPGGIALRASPELDLTHAGQVVSGLLITGGVTIGANNVTLKDDKIITTMSQAVQILPGVTGVTIEDTTIAGIGGGACSVGIAASGFVAIRVDISGCQDGIHANGNSTIEGSFIHNLAITPTSHNDCVQIMSGSNVVVSGNSLLNPNQKNSAIHIKGDTGPISNVIVEYNLMDGGSHTVQVDDGSFSVRGVQIIHNTLGCDYIYGWAAVASTNPVTWTANVWADNGQPVPSPPNK